MSSVPATYKAYTYEQYGKTEEQVHVRELTTGAVPASHVRVKVHSAALNPIDYCLVEFLGPVLIGGAPSEGKPYGFGFDAAGEIVEVGPGVDSSKFKVGDAVFAMTAWTRFGSVAEFVDIDQQYVAHKPASFNYDQAASLPLASLTSYQALFEHVKHQAGQRVLILGGSSSTGIFAVQFAKSIGAYVITTASERNKELVKSLGADEIIDYRSQKWVDVVEHHSIDVLYDCGMEPLSWNTDAQTVLKKETGQYITLEFMEKSDPPRYGAKNHGQMAVQPSAKNLEAIAKLVDGGKLKTVMDSVLPFDKAIEGILHVKSRRAVGKVVIKVL